MSAPRLSNAGFSLIGVVVSMSILSVGLMGLAGLTAASARRAAGVGHLNRVAQTMTQQVNRIGAMPYDSLTLGVSCRAMSSNGFDYTRCMRVDSLDMRVKRITLVITPANTFYRPATEIFQRSRPVVASALYR